MRVSFKWLKEYVDISISPMELAERLTLAGLAVEGIHDLGEGIKNVFVGKILKIEPHPNADKLVVCSVTIGDDETRQIVTGATNVREGHVIPVAVEGAKLAGGLVIKRAKLRGIESRGMLCSGEELGLDPKTMPADQAHGIMILPEDTPLGQDIKGLVGLDDVILELDLTPNRGDALSMVGVARDVAALLGQPLKAPVPQVAELNESIEGKARVDVEDMELCRRYVARLFTNVKVGPSPFWMQERLRAAGIRPISNIVDITNYVMLELGQPLHAFDYDTLKDGHIIVRRAKKDEVLVSLDNVERKLAEDMLVIADPSGPVAVAGVMGGLATEVTEGTVNVLLESAYFNPVSVRRTSRALGLRSESSSRFEKGIDIEGCRRAADRAAQLLQQMGAGEVAAGVVDNFPAPIERKPIILRPLRVGFILGVEVPRKDIKDILTGLDFQVQDAGAEELLVSVPSHRPDVSLEIDLIEEVARIYGYNNIPVAPISGSTIQGARTREQAMQARIKDVLTGCGLTEVVTYSFTNQDVFDRFNISLDSPLRNTIKLQNPLSEEQAVMRTLMLPGLVEVLQRNFNRRVQNGAVFEIGRVFIPRPGEALPEERTVLAMATMGKTEGSWNTAAQEIDFYFLKGVLENLFEDIGVVGLSFEPETANSSFHPGRTGRIMAGETVLGIVGELHPDVLENYEIPQRVVGCELDLVAVASVSGNPRRYRQLPRFPGVERDIAVVVKQDVSVGDLLRLIRKAGGTLLREVKLFDVYRGEHVKEGYQSLAFSLKFQADDRTLTDAEVAERTASITNTLAKQQGAELRS